MPEKGKFIRPFTMVLASLALAACSPVSPTPPATPTAPISMVTPRAHVAQLPAREGIEAVEYLTPYQESSTDAGPKINVAYPVITAAPSLQAYINAYVQGQRTYFRSLLNANEPNSAFTISWDILAHAGPYLGFVVESNSTTLAQNSHHAISVFTDIEHDVTLSGQDLFTDDGRRMVARAVASAVQTAGYGAGKTIDQFSSQLLEQPNGLANVALTGTGAVVVLDPSDTGCADFMAIALDDDLANEALSEPAHAINEAIANKTPFVGLPSPEQINASEYAISLPEVDCAVAACVALTYDDGPGEYTLELLRYLHEANAPATFFMVGRSVHHLPDIAGIVAEAGHTIGNHTYSHPQLPKIASAEVNAELARTDAEIEAAAGVKTPWVRPPYGAVTPAVMKELAGRGQAAVLWDVDTEDWKNRNIAETTRRALAAVQPGSIILMHDIHESSVKATPGIIKALRDKGFTIVSLEQLVGQAKPGVKYFSRNNAH